MTHVVLYTRPGCHLCDDARAMLERARATLAFDLLERDIEDDEALLRRYLERIPVIEIDGEEAFELLIDETELHRHLGRVQSR
jgi:glutaredoxin